MTDAPTPPASAPDPAAPPRRAGTILGRLARALREQNWFAVALELGIVVLGVVIGFQVTAWGQAQQARALETESLRELRSALVNDLEDIRNNIRSHERAAASSQLVREHIQARAPYSDTLDSHFGRAMAITISHRDEAAYETLKQRGLETLTNDSIRVLIGRLYGAEYQTVESYQVLNSAFVFENTFSFYNTHFQNLVPFRSATPVDYSALLTSTEYAALLDWAVYLHPVLVRIMEQSEREVVALIALLDDELAHR